MILNPPVSLIVNLIFVSCRQFYDFDLRMEFARRINRDRESTFSRVVEERTTSRGRERRACEGVVSFNPQREPRTFLSRVHSVTSAIPSTGCQRLIHLSFSQLSHCAFVNDLKRVPALYDFWTGLKVVTEIELDRDWKQAIVRIYFHLKRLYTNT